MRVTLGRRGLFGPFLLGSMALLPGCGFRPVYAPGTGGADGPATVGLAAINVPVLAERNGQLLRQALQERFERGSGPQPRLYDLVVAYTVVGEPIGYQRDNSITRVRLVGSATWSLLAQDALRSTLTTGAARDVDGYNVLDQQYFASDLTSETVQRRVAEAVADQIALQLATFFVRRTSAAPG